MRAAITIWSQVTTFDVIQDGHPRYRLILAFLALIGMTYVLYRTLAATFSPRVAFLVLLFLSLLLYAIFWLLFAQYFVVLALLVLTGMFYVLWRAAQP